MQGKMTAEEFEIAKQRWAQLVSELRDDASPFADWRIIERVLQHYVVSRHPKGDFNLPITEDMKMRKLYPPDDQFNEEIEKSLKKHSAEFNFTRKLMRICSAQTKETEKPRTILLYGPSGSGKGMLAKEIATYPFNRKIHPFISFAEDVATDILTLRLDDSFLCPVRIAVSLTAGEAKHAIGEAIEKTRSKPQFRGYLPEFNKDVMNRVFVNIKSSYRGEPSDKQLILTDDRLKEIVLAVFLSDINDIVKKKEEAEKKLAWVDLGVLGINENAARSELFGHEKGAYTDAYNTYQGAFENAGKNGVVFIDELQDASLKIQAMLRDVIDTGRFRRMMGKSDLNFSGRIILASHKNLWEMVQTGEFREDLYYRIGGNIVKLPPLKNPWVIGLLLASRLVKQGKTFYALSDRVTRHLVEERTYCGNIRELERILDRFLLYDPVEQEEYFEELLTDPMQEEYKQILETQKHQDELQNLIKVQDRNRASDEFDKLYCEHWLKQCGYNQKRTAEQINIHPSTLSKNLDKWRRRSEANR